MSFFEVLLMGVALSMDACALGMTNGMTDPKMPFKRALLIGGCFGFFQFLMPLIGYFITGVIANAFLGTFQKISSWISFTLLAFLGGKMIFDSVRCLLATRKIQRGESLDGAEGAYCNVEKLTIGKLLLQAVATSIDALAVGVTLQMAAISENLVLGPWGSTATIGLTTFLLSVGAVYIGKLVGDKLADKASLIGGLVLVGIGLKILIEGLIG